MAGRLSTICATEVTTRKVESTAYMCSSKRERMLTGGIKKYEHSHLNDIAAIFVPKFAHRSLPPEIVRRVVEYAFHVGDY